jgi:hypothetical protein
MVTPPPPIKNKNWIYIFLVNIQKRQSIVVNLWSIILAKQQQTKNK